MKMSIWNLLTLLLLIGTFGMLVVFGAIFILPNQILPVGMRPISIPPTPIIPTVTETPFQFPPTWTKVPPLPTETSTPLLTSTATPTNTSVVIPSKTLTPTSTTSVTATRTKTRTPVTVVGGGTVARTPTKTRTKTPNKTATDCPPGQCFTKAVDDKVTVTPYPGYIVVNVRANDLPSGINMHITNLLNCPKPCQEDKYGSYKTFAGGKARIISQMEIAYYPPVGFIGTDVIGYKITSDAGSVDTADVIFNVTDGSYAIPTDITPHTFFTDAGLPIPSFVGSFSTTGGSGPFSYKFVTGDGSSNNNYFSLTTSGDINSAGMFTASVLSIRVRSTDANNFWIEQQIQVFVAMTPTPTRTMTPTRTLTPTRTPTATATNSPPTITSNGGGATANIAIVENTTAVTTVVATDADVTPTLTYSISGGADAALFAIDSSSGVLTFIVAPTVASPTDANTDSVYEVTVEVSDGAAIDTQDISVTVHS